jgi:ribosome-interacting GTPase 1
MVDLSQNPLLQIEAILEQLRKMRIVIGDAEDDQESEEAAIWHKKVLIVGNKADLDSNGGNHQLILDSYKDKLPVVAISARDGRGLEELKFKIYQMLDIIRVYTKTPREKADLTEPIVLPRGSTLQDAAAAVHKDFAARMKYARIWGSGKHEGIMVRRDHALEDGDVIELHL